MSVPNKPLKFIHITKTAGSSIEAIGLEQNIRWGINHTEYGFWHEIFKRKPESLRKKYDWFTVVRNPYKRILSEYHFLINALKINENHTIQQFNTFITKWIKNASQNIENHPIFGRVGGDHFTEQYKYLDSSTKIHVLKFENLEIEFNALMKLYNYKCTLNKKIQVSKNKRFTINDLSKDTIKLINTVYKKDFEFFGYTMEDNLELSPELFIVSEPEPDPEPAPKLVPAPKPAPVPKQVSAPPLPSPLKRNLRFIHITRTGGTSIEQIGLDNEKFWGRYHRGYGQFDEIFNRKPPQLKTSHDWFVVVRNPYTRVISDFSYLSLILNIKNKTVESFNSFIRTWITNISQNKENHPIHGKVSGGHFTPQYKYIDLNINIHVLKFENLESEFNKLMKDYEYPIVLNKKVNVSKPLFTLKDISEENKILIQQVYKKDFELFKYDF